MGDHARTTTQVNRVLRDAGAMVAVAVFLGGCCKAISQRLPIARAAVSEKNVATRSEFEAASLRSRSGGCVLDFEGVRNDVINGIVDGGVVGSWLVVGYGIVAKVLVFRRSRSCRRHWYRNRRRRRNLHIRSRRRRSCRSHRRPTQPRRSPPSPVVGLPRAGLQQKQSKC